MPQVWTRIPIDRSLMPKAPLPKNHIERQMSQSRFLMRIIIIGAKSCHQHSVKHLSTQPDRRRPVIRWTTLKGLITVILFLAVTALIEYFVVLYAMGLGVQDKSVSQWSFRFPGTGWPVTIAISPVFHLVPICVIITLGFSWTYLTKKVTLRRQEIRRGKVETFPRQRIERKGLISRVSRAARSFSRKIKSGLSRTRGISYLSQRIHFARPTIRSALTVLLVFVAFTLLFSLLAYPQLIYRSVSNAYQTNLAFRNFVISVNNWVKGVAEALGPIGWLGTSINNALIAAAPGVRSLGVGFGGLISPLATLDNVGKYLFFQNATAWISVLVVIVYGERTGKGYRYKK
jgi:hypothetical protein